MAAEAQATTLTPSFKGFDKKSVGGGYTSLEHISADGITVQKTEMKKPSAFGYSDVQGAEPVGGGAPVD